MQPIERRIPHTPIEIAFPMADLGEIDIEQGDKHLLYHILRLVHRAENPLGIEHRQSEMLPEERFVFG